MRERLLAGVDSGGTKIDVIIGDSLGNVRAFASGLGGIPRRLPGRSYLDRLRAVIDNALAKIGTTLDECEGIEFGIGLAGYDWPSQRNELLALLRELPNAAAIDLVNDTIIALHAGSEQGWGACIEAGTGCNCRGLDRTGNEYRIIGTGHMFAEYGSAISIAERAVQAVGHEWSHRGPKTAITKALLSAYNQDSKAALIENISIGVVVVGPEFARTVLDLATSGDLVAHSILSWAARELADLICAVAGQFTLPNEPIEIIGAGRLLDRSSPLWTLLRENTVKRLPRAELISLCMPAALGGLLLTPTAKRNGLREQFYKSWAASEFARDRRAQ